jgi:hypothetical protein
MITSYLQGGLGNQMFQIAAAYTLSLKLNVECKFDFKASFVSTQGYGANKYKDNIFKNVNNGEINFSTFKQYREPEFKFNELPLVDNLVLIGNFQSEKYLPENKDELLELFNFEDEINNNIKRILLEQTKGDTVTAIHVRRGDYLLNPNFHPVCSLEYYKEAIAIIGKGKYILLSDDMDWCKKNFVGEEFIYSPFTNEIEDLYLMMNCDNHIIANSSFSWWGAYLSKNNDNKVIAPKTWFGPNGPQDTKDIYLNKWIKI